MIKNRSGKIRLLMVAFVAFGLLYGGHTVFAANQQKVLKTNVKVLKVDPSRLQLKLKADVAIVGLYSGPCMCSEDMIRYHHAISPKNMSVYIFNNSQSLSVNVKVTLTYFSLARSPGKWKTFTKNVTINKNSKVSVNFWLNTYYDIIKIEGAKKIKIKAEITNSNVIDPVLSNNVWYSTNCEYYIQ